MAIRRLDGSMPDNLLGMCLVCFVVLIVLLLALADGGSAQDPAPWFVEPKLPEICDKTLVVWCTPANLTQRGGGVLTLECEGRFDAVVFGEIAPRKWMAGSDMFTRTQTDQSTNEIETAGPEQLIQIAIVYRDATVTLFRNGVVYAEYSVAKPTVFADMSKILMGRRHEMSPARSPGHFTGTIDEARLYDAALTARQIQSLRPNVPSDRAPLGMWTFEDGSAKDQMGTFPAGELHGGAYVADGRLCLDGKDDFLMTPAQVRYAPTMHYRPEGGVLGDTILFYWNGVYHVFYLQGPSWGHISSRDLIHWKQLPDAIERGSGSASPDGQNCWTGSIVEHEGTFHLFYTGKNSNDPKGDQKVMHATSTDLTRWTKHPEYTFYADGKIYWSKPINGSVDDKLNYHHQAFRDPEVFFNEQDGNWWLLLHAALADGSSPVFALYVSGDLIRWSPHEPIFDYPKSVSGDCPHIFKTNGKWYIIAAEFHYTVADSPGGPYRPEMLPFGCGEMAVPKTMFDGQRRVLAGWIHDHEGCRDAGKPLWGGMMSMPRELYADEQGRLCQRPIQEVIDAYNHAVLELPGGIEPGQTLEVPRDYMLNCRLRPTSPDAAVAIGFRQPADDPAAGYRLRVDFRTQEIELGGRHRTYQRVCDFDPTKPLDLRLFVDGTVIECFVNDAYCFTMRAFDYMDSGLSHEATRGSVEVRNLTVRTAG